MLELRDPSQLWLQGAPPRPSSYHVTRKRQTALLIRSEGRAMIGGSDRYVRRLPGLVAAFSIVGGPGRDASPGEFLRQNCLEPFLPSCSPLRRLPVNYAALSVCGNQMPLRRITESSTAAFPAASAAPSARFRIGCRGLGRAQGEVRAAGGGSRAFPRGSPAEDRRRPLVVCSGNAWRWCCVRAALFACLTPGTQRLLT